jgi:prolyl oligopeptidase
MNRRIAAALLMPLSTIAIAQPAADPYAWLEEVQGEKAIAWVKDQNAVSQRMLESHPEFKSLHEKLLAIYNSRERIPGVQKRGAYLYNFWQDKDNPRGLWRRTTLDEYRKPQPAWETILDMDKLGREENETWVYKGATCLYPDYRRCLVSLSRGGKDAVVIREFDVEKREFAKGGFELAESKGSAAWRDADTLYVSRDFGAGTMTRSGYPRQVKEWKRGTPLADAKLVYEAKESDIGAFNAVRNEKDRRYELYVRAIDTRLGENFLRVGDRWVLLDVPQDSNVQFGQGRLFVQLRTDWRAGNTLYKAGSLIAADLDGFLAGKRDFSVVFEQRPRASLQAYAITRTMLILDVLDNVKGRIYEARPGPGRWALREVAVPEAASIGVAAVDHDAGDEYWMTVTSFIEPTTLYLSQGGSDRHAKLKNLPAFFDAKGLKVTQHEATSRDGTKIPYFVVMRESAKLDGKNPTILYGYGGFEQSMTPNYSGTIGTAWLEKGGVWVLANLRGGGEFGPEWHLTARREGRQKTHDDYIAVAEDLIKRGVSSPRHLGIMGGSQGGLLVGAAFTQRPELFRAVVAQVPLMDMKRYHKLLAGASWMGEYGNPDEPADWAFMSKYSPYQNVAKDKKYPKIFFTTSTRDDRVHPGHARKMFALMKEQGHDVVYFEYLEGGHAAGTTPAQNAYTWALTYTFLLNELR